MESEEMALMDLVSGQQWRNRYRDQTYGQGGRRGGRRGDVLCDRLKGGVGRKMEGRSGRDGTWVYLWLILVDV